MMNQTGYAVTLDQSVGLLRLAGEGPDAVDAPGRQKCRLDDRSHGAGTGLKVQVLVFGIEDVVQPATNLGPGCPQRMCRVRIGYIRRVHIVRETIPGSPTDTGIVRELTSLRVVQEPDVSPGTVQYGHFEETVSPWYRTDPREIELLPGRVRV